MASAFGTITFMSKFLGRFPSFVWPSLCTIKQRTETEEASGEVVVTYPTDLPNHVAIPCREAPLIVSRPTDNEMGIGSRIQTEKQRHVMLKGYYNATIDVGMGAVIDGVTHNIVGIESDGSKTYTRLRTEIITP